ncbi:hypothetical protein [Methanobrevibacter sp.]|uniref:hypothetical protein n=1 Tax=Methanobrevibacter sp. TaxID=66852 RepID=UPI0026DFFF03|nr:hypothetical protein [Methanobrevibacter sp.]MDO5859825.1 hypothetical protein [Methanobrevibacter sp.]
MRRKKKQSGKRHLNNDYYNRELLLNKKIRQFQNDYYNLLNPPLHDEYMRMDVLRRDIKYLLRCQEYQVWQKSYNRKHAYFDQLSLFKSMYIMWKRRTFFTYIEVYHQVPHHIALWAKTIGANMVPNGVFGT